ncbi:hypothetical protein PHLGIDRAFT_118196 [Phlebiopsis gigantea 11061_1 CR5-6]|uniref:LysM domain-containing protein n=1 Tax=Phlebiopsis gigantea (strain 11061_1 CR5-6) TaxID=745531 RepID=A0A0C3NQC4_PHLG1|nr:hypothetical protein PHLGIDRAFT_118196 [Phlebiopsis gigantea 11061_1 CR5-6]
MFSKLPVFLIVGAFAGAFAQVPPDCDRTYTVQSGDTCNAISKNHAVSTFQLGFVNPGINSGCTNLFVGALLCLGRAGQDCTITHTVESGEFCSEIAGNTGTTVSTLLANNPNVNSGCTNLQVGEVLCTASNVFDYTSA